MSSKLNWDRPSRVPRSAKALPRDKNRTPSERQLAKLRELRARLGREDDPDPKTRATAHREIDRLTRVAEMLGR